MDKRSQEYEAQTGNHFTCGQPICKDCGFCTYCICICRKFKKIKIGIVVDEQGMAHVFSDQPDTLEIVKYESEVYDWGSHQEKRQMDKIRQKIESMQELE